MTETLAPYEFDYAMSRLKDAIDYAFQTGEFEGVRLWAMNVEESHKAEVKDLSDSMRDANEGAHLMYMYGQVGEAKLLQDWDLPSGTPEYKEAQQVSDKFNFDTVTEQEF